MWTVLQISLSFCLALFLSVSTVGAAQEWPLWKSYVNGFMDSQIRVIDHDAGDRTTSEAQAYAMFFALVANDRVRFDGLLRWTEQNLAGSDLSTHLPAWAWGRTAENKWGVIDSNAAADADVWMAYTLLEAGRAWNSKHYADLGAALAQRIATEEVAAVPGLGTMLLPAPKGFHRGDAYRLNASYVPLQLMVGLAHLLPNGPWKQIAAAAPILISRSAPHGFAMDWIEFGKDSSSEPSALGSYEAIRVYLWAGMLDPKAPQRIEILKALSGMEQYLRSRQQPPAKVKLDGTIDDPNGAVGFAAALMPYLSAIGDKDARDRQMNRVRSELDPATGLYGKPAKYYDQNLLLFALGSEEHRFWFDSHGEVKTSWRH